jgi:hypothetical protein
LLAITPPRKTARGREQCNLVLYLTLAGNAGFTNAEIRQLTSEASMLFYQSTGSLTFAMRNVANDINSKLLARNLSSSGQGQQALGLLALAAIREAQCTLLLSGPTHAVWVTEGHSRHIHDPALSGKGLGSGQSISTYLSQVELRPQDLLVLCAIFPRDWEADLLNERPPASLDASYRKLTFTKGDLNAVLIQAQSGHGTLTLLRPAVSAARHALHQAVPSAEVAPSSAQTQEEVIPPVTEAVAPQAVESQTNEQPESHAADSPSTISERELDSLADFAAHMVQPSAYAIPPQPGGLTPVPQEETKSNGGRGFPASIPRAKPVEQEMPAEEISIVEKESAVEEEPVKPVSRAKPKKRLFRPNAHAEATRQMAKVMVGGIRSGRRVNERLRTALGRFVPRLLPGGDGTQPLVVPTYLLVIIAVIIPVIVVTMASVVYFRLGQSIQYDELYGQALNARAQAVSETDPARQRDAWQRVLNSLNNADGYRVTDESELLRNEAQSNLDRLMGILRLEFVPAFPNGVGGSSSTVISRMAASESDLYMLTSPEGKILHASFTGRSLELDNAFSCQPGTYAGYQVGTLIDLLALPKVNALGATVLGIDGNGNLLYCAPDQVPQAIPLPSLPNTNWGKIMAFALENDNLYVLDAQSRAVWVFQGQSSSFIATPYFYFGNEIPVSIDSAIDLAVSNDDLYMLHADGHLSTCTFSRISDAPTRCQDPAPRVDNYPAHRDVDVFKLTHFTQMSLTNPPNSVILLLDSPNQSVFRFSPRSFELQNQVSSFAGEANPFKRGSVTAIAVSPNYVLYLAIVDQVYFATNLP